MVGDMPTMNYTFSYPAASGWMKGYMSGCSCRQFPTGVCIYAVFVLRLCYNTNIFSGRYKPVCYIRQLTCHCGFDCYCSAYCYCIATGFYNIRCRLLLSVVLIQSVSLHLSSSHQDVGYVLSRPRFPRQYFISRGCREQIEAKADAEWPYVGHGLLQREALLYAPPHLEKNRRSYIVDRLHT